MSEHVTCDGPECDHQHKKIAGGMMVDNFWLTLSRNQGNAGTMMPKQNRFDFCSWRCLEEYAKKHAS